MTESNQNSNTQINNRRVYKKWMVGLAAFLGGPLAGGYLIAQNFKAFGQTEEARKAWIWTIIGTVLVLLISLYIPESLSDIGRLLPILYTGIMYIIVNVIQKENIDKVIDAGGELHSWGRVIVVGLISFVITFTIIVAFVFALDL